MEEQRDSSSRTDCSSLEKEGKRIHDYFCDCLLLNCEASDFGSCHLLVRQMKGI